MKKQFQNASCVRTPLCMSLPPASSTAPAAELCRIRSEGVCETHEG